MSDGGGGGGGWEGWIVSQLLMWKPKLPETQIPYVRCVCVGGGGGGYLG